MPLRICLAAMLMSAVVGAEVGLLEESGKPKPRVAATDVAPRGRVTMAELEEERVALAAPGWFKWLKDIKESVTGAEVDPRLGTVVLPDGRTADGRIVIDYRPDLRFLGSEADNAKVYDYELRHSKDPVEHYECLRTIADSAIKGSGEALGTLSLWYSHGLKASYSIPWPYHDEKRADWFRSASILRACALDDSIAIREREATLEKLRGMLFSGIIAERARERSGSISSGDSVGRKLSPSESSSRDEREKKVR